jgi:hypothetical protein
MKEKELEKARLKFEDVARYLKHSEWLQDGRSLIISCSEEAAAKLEVRLDILVLSFEHLEKVVINGSVVFDVPLPEIPDPSAYGEVRVVQILRPSKALLKARFPLIEMKR